MKKFTLLLLLLLGMNSFSQAEFITNVVVSGVKVNNKIVFMNNSPEYGKELWVSDGTVSGTNILRDIVVGTVGSVPNQLTLLDDIVYFRTESHQIWRTDGTTAGTYLMVNNNLIANPANFIKSENFIFFYSGSAGLGCCKKLWRMNTNPNSENIVTPTNNFNDVGDLIVFDYENDVILFNAQTNVNGWAIWRTNGGVSLMVKDLYTQNLDLKQMAYAKKIGSEIYFGGFSTDFGAELWKTDATSQNTVMIKDIYVDTNYFNGSRPGLFMKIGSKVFFTAADNIHGIEVWVTDGSTAGTHLVKDVYPGNNHSGQSPGSFLEMNGLLYFTQNDGTGTQIWKSDGTEDGTIKVTNIPNYYVQGTLFEKDGILYFGMYSPEFGMEPWKITPNGEMSMIKDVFPGVGGSDPSSFFELNDYVYFIATNNGSYSGMGTYRVNGSNLNTSMNNLDNVLLLYPNPTSGFLNIQKSHSSEFKIEVFDIIGKKVGQFLNQNKIDISILNSGIYLIKITDLQTNKIHIKKIVKQ